MQSADKHFWIERFNSTERKISSTSVARPSSGIDPLENGAEGGRVSAFKPDDLTGLLSNSLPDTVERILSIAREHLGMDVAFLSEFVQGKQVYRTMAGDAASFGIREGGSIALEGTFCQRLIDGRISNIVIDSSNEEQVRDLDVTREAGIGSYVGVPLRFTDGRLYGTLCCLSHMPDPSLRSRDAEVVKMLGQLILEQLEREELASKGWRLRIKETGVEALLVALEARDGYTGEHSTAVVELSVAVARRLELSEEEVSDIKQAALLHDVGKIGIIDAILNKPGALDEEEWEAMKEHPKIGERIVSSLESLAHLAPVIRAEHERWDGTGYPDGLAGEQIPLASRIIFTCDAFHAMVSDRPYRKALGVRRALAELERNAGTQFCPRTVSALLAVVNEGRPDEKWGWSG